MTGNKTDRFNRYTALDETSKGVYMWDYGPRTEMGIISECSSCHKLGHKLTRPLSHELCKKVLSVYSPTLSNTWELFQHLHWIRPSTRLSENIKLTHTHSHELCKKVLSILFSYSLTHIESIKHHRIHLRL